MLHVNECVRAAACNSVNYGAGDVLCEKHWHEICTHKSMRVILGLMRIQCHCKPRGFKQGCVEGFMIHIKISNGFLLRHTRFKRGQSSHRDVV